MEMTILHSPQLDEHTTDTSSAVAEYAGYSSRSNSTYQLILGCPGHNEIEQKYQTDRQAGGLNGGGARPLGPFDQRGSGLGLQTQSLFGQRQINVVSLHRGPCGQCFLLLLLPSSTAVLSDPRSRKAC